MIASATRSSGTANDCLSPATVTAPPLASVAPWQLVRTKLLGLVIGAAPDSTARAMPVLEADDGDDGDLESD